MSLTSHQRCEAECVRPCINLALTVDTKEFLNSASLFAADAIWHHVTDTYRGRQKIFKVLNALPPDLCTRHICTNMTIDVIDESNAIGSSNMLLQGPSCGEGLPAKVANTFVAENLDRYVLHEGRWQIAPPHLLEQLPLFFERRAHHD